MEAMKFDGVPTENDVQKDVMGLHFAADHLEAFATDLRKRAIEMSLMAQASRDVEKELNDLANHMPYPELWQERHVQDALGVSLRGMYHAAEEKLDSLYREWLEQHAYYLEQRPPQLRDVA